MPEPENEEEESEDSVVAEGTDEAAQEFPGVRLKVELLGEDGEALGGGENKKAVSVFSNVDFLLGRNRAAKDKEDDKKGSGTRARQSEDDDEPAQETRDPVSIVFETNGRCEPHRILVWKDGKDEGSATVLEVDRFGAIKNPEAEDDRR